MGSLGISCTWILCVCVAMMELFLWQNKTKISEFSALNAKFLRICEIDHTHCEWHSRNILMKCVQWDEDHRYSSISTQCRGKKWINSRFSVSSIHMCQEDVKQIFFLQQSVNLAEIIKMQPHQPPPRYWKACTADSAAATAVISAK